MSELTADQARFYFKTDAGRFDVLNFEGQEAMSTPYHFSVTLKAPDRSVDPESMIRKRAFLTLITKSTKERHINGIIGRASLEESGHAYTIYRVEIFPLFWILGWSCNSRIFQHMNVPDIISEVLTKAGFSRSDFQMKVNTNYPERPYCLQYRETDLDFISRLASEEGIFFFFRQESEKEVVVFGDGISAHPDCHPEAEATYIPQTEHLSKDDDIIFAFSVHASLHTGKITLNDYNEETPDTQLLFMSAGNMYQDLEWYDHHGGYKDPEYGEALARKHREAASSHGRILCGKGRFRCLCAGHKLKIAGHPDSALNKQYLILSVNHRGTLSQGLHHGEGGAVGLIYESSFRAVPAEVVIRPLRVLKKPYVPIQSAMVVGKAGEEIYTDGQGRVKIQFHWDREGKKDENSSCWVRVSQSWAGAGWGSFYIPRVNQEVLVDFIDGDPDRPVIISSVYNGINMPPYSDSATKSGFKSSTSPGGSGSNELYFDDAKGAEEVYLHGQKNFTLVVENDHTQTVKKNLKQAVKEDKKVEIDKNMEEIVKENKKIEVVKEFEIKVGQDFKEMVTGNATLNVEKNRHIGVKKDFELEADGNVDIKSKDKITIASKKEIVLKAGNACIILKESGDIIIKGSGKITVKSNSDVVIKGSKILGN
ncbi:MAG: type VI secretion system tip protein VgrG [Desulfamplus sp.]|nr:type VI secretion system tip protein VgrG [Desulfamplus sp.]